MRRWCIISLIGLALLYALLLIPEAEPVPPAGAGQAPFVWARDALWRTLEAELREARQLSPPGRTARFSESLERLHRTLDQMASTPLPPEAEVFDVVETNFFQLAVFAAVTPERNKDFMTAAARFAQLARGQAQSWASDSEAARQRRYRLLFGRRAAVEAVMLQMAPAFEALELASGYDSSATPAAEVHGVRLHSGDILVSRGGAATSALIARGNDYPGNFSHVALVHVGEQTKAVSVIESHIESGVGVRPLAEYLADTKLRILVLRLRDDLPAMQTNPQLPHHAASLALSNVLARHIPYDFAMAHTDPSQQFCSEVVSAAYLPQGITLWERLSQISAPGLVRWLTMLGVRNFESQQPSDLEYDPQLRFIAEWRNPESLFQDHVDNAVTDALLEAAERGAELDYNRWLLPFVRLAKAWSVGLNQLGGVGPVPEGMSATTALRVKQFKARHAVAQSKVMQAAAQFQRTNGYAPPNWELLRLAREAIQTP